MTDPNAIPNMLSAQKHHSSHPALVIASVAAGAYIGYRTKDTAFAKAVGALVWIVLGLLLIVCAVAGLLDTDTTVGGVLACGFLVWLGCWCLWIAVRPSLRHRADLTPQGPTHLVAYGQRTYDCCRHCASCRIRDVHLTPCSCAGQAALRQVVAEGQRRATCAAPACEEPPAAEDPRWWHS